SRPIQSESCTKILTLKLHRLSGGQVIVRGRGVVPNLRNQPIGSVLALLQKAGYRPGAIGFTNTKDCRFSRRVASQIPGAGRRLQRGGRVSLQAYWCVR
ncbi:MAG: PASTA domain-containing protein, partial [Nitrospinota bacterium]|nr:PASTA domain-containing protein [Nitrospinota bacterium]